MIGRLVLSLLMHRWRAHEEVRWSRASKQIEFGLSQVYVGWGTPHERYLGDTAGPSAYTVSYQYKAHVTVESWPRRFMRGLWAGIKVDLAKLRQP